MKLARSTRLFLVAGVILPALIIPSKVAAASCIGLTPTEKTQRAQVIFTGELIEIIPKNFLVAAADEASVSLDRFMNRPIDGFLLEDGQVEFQVETVFQGEVRRRQRVATSLRSSVSVDFHVGRTHTVFARSSGGYLSTTECDGTVEGLVDLDEYGLENGRPPTNGFDSNPIPGQEQRVRTLLLVIFGGLALVGIPTIIGIRRLNR